MNKQAKVIIISLMYTIGIISFLYPAFYSLGILSIILCFFLYKKKFLFSIKYFIAIILTYFVGIINCANHLNYYDDLSSYCENTNVTLNAQVITIPSNSQENKTKFFAKVNSIEFDDVKQDNLKAKTYITINDEAENISRIKIGDNLRVTGRLKAPENAKNPSQFDYAKYLQYKNTFSLMYVKDDWEIISSATNAKGNFLRKLNDTRNNILSIHKQNISSPMIEILGGIIFGDDAVNPDETTKDNFTKSGILHILAASGMNVTLIFGIWIFLATKLKFNYNFSILMGITLISVYTCMTGFGPPIIRAFLMLTLVLIGKLIDRETSTISLLFLVGLLMLIINPLMAFDIGFQLSFIVTFALIITAPLIDFKFKHKWINYTIGACMIPLIAQIYAAPLQMFYFNTFNIYSVITNIAIIPVLSIVSFIGFISSAIALIPFLAQKVCFLADLILNPLLIYIYKMAELFSSLPNSVIDISKPSLLQLILYFSIIILLTCIFAYKLNKKKTLTITGILTIIFCLTFIPINLKQTEIIFYSVGNADSCLIKTPQNKYFLIDTGKSPYLSSSSQAKNIIIKYLKDKGIKKIDGLILSHFDSDHAGGTIDILKEINTQMVYFPNTFEDTILSENIIHYIKENNINYKIVEKEIEIIKENDLNIKATVTTNKTIKDENEKSVIVLLKDKNQKALFMGDAGISAYNTLPKEYKENISIIKSGHHGGKNTVNNEIAKNSDLFIISTGINIYSHPSKETLEIIEQNNKKYLRTDEYNAIKIAIKNNRYKIRAYSPKQRDFKDL